MDCRLLALFILVPTIACQKADGPPAARPAPPKMAMTTDFPEGISTPDYLETRIGALSSFDGVPDVATTELVYDNLDFQRGVHTYLTTLPIASMAAMRTGLLEFGPANTTAVQYEQLMDSKSFWLTPNTVNVYMAAWLEMDDQPWVIETPPDVLGFVNDFWFHYVVDFGRMGPDLGKGGKFLILPPGYEGDVPEGYHVAQSSTHGNWVIWRGFQVDGDPKPAVAATQERFRIYPLSQRDNPPAMNFVNGSGVVNNTIHRMDFGFWEEVDHVIQAEPSSGMDPETLGLLASIGIVKGQPFAPDERMRAILTEAADVGAVTARALTARPRDERIYLYPGEGVWTNPFIDNRYDFIVDGARMLDSRIYMHFYATGITPAMTKAPVGKGSKYAIAYLDSDGNALDGSKTYSIHVPANVPAREYWSFTLYDNQSRAMLQTDQQFPGLDNKSGTLQMNEDGSCDVYFGPVAPEGKEANWIQTVPDKGWNTIFRLYGPEQEWIDRTWRIGDPKLID